LPSFSGRFRSFPLSETRIAGYSDRRPRRPALNGGWTIGLSPGTRRALQQRLLCICCGIQAIDDAVVTKSARRLRALGIAGLFTELVSRSGQILPASVLTQKMQPAEPGAARIEI
jgi:hypothetical protein